MGDLSMAVVEAQTQPSSRIEEGIIYTNLEAFSGKVGKIQGFFNSILGIEPKKKKNT